MAESSSSQREEAAQQGGILKKTRCGRRRGSSSGIRWDEEVIAEHDKERGTRQKIIEPKTPYERTADLDDLLAEPDDGEGGGLMDEWAALQEQLEGEASGGGGEWEDDAPSASPHVKVAEANVPEATPATEDEAKKKEEFRAARKAHYAEEGRKMRELLRQQHDDGEEDDGDDG